MATKPIYRISLATSAVFSTIFILLLLFGLLTTKELVRFDILMYGSFFLTFLVIIFFDLICYRVNRYNKEQVPVPWSIKRAGNILFAFNLLATLYIIFCVIAGIYSLQSADKSMKKSGGVFIFLICYFSVLIIAAVINVVHYIKSVRKNKGIINEFVNTIGS